MNEAQATEQEQTYVETGFGTVTSKRVIYFREKGWFSGGSRTDIPLKHVTSVRLETSRSILGGIFNLLLALGLLPQGGGATIFGILALILAIFLLWGSPNIVVNTAGNDKNTSKGLPWHRKDAHAFVDNLRKQLFQE